MTSGASDPSNYNAGHPIDKAVIATLPAGSSVTFTYSSTATITLNATCGEQWATFYNVATVDSQDGQVTARATRFSEKRTFSDVAVQTSVSPSAGGFAGDAITLGATIQSACGTATDVVVNWKLPPKAGFDVADPLGSLVCTAPAGSSCPAFSYDPATRTISATFAQLDPDKPYTLSLDGTAGLGPSGGYPTTVTAVNSDDTVPATNTATSSYPVANNLWPLSVQYTLQGQPSPVELTFTGTLKCAVQGDTPWTITLPAGDTSTSARVTRAWQGDTCTFVADGLPTPPAGYGWAGQLTHGPLVIDPVREAFTEPYLAELVPLASPLSVRAEDRTTTVGHPIRPITSVVTGGTGPFSYTASGLPAGVGIDPATGVISGTPRVAGRYVYTVTVTDASGATATATNTITVNEERDSLAMTGPGIGTIAVVVAGLLAALGGVGLLMARRSSRR